MVGQSRSLTVPRIPSIRLAVLLAIGTVSFTSAQSTSRPTATPTTQPASPPAVVLDPQSEAILTRLESLKFRDLQAKLRWTRLPLDQVFPDVEVRMGEIWYQEAEPAAKFKVHFTKSIAAKRVDNIEDTYLFDGFWFTEVQSSGRSVTRREIRSKDDKTSPYRLGEGMFPIPFGQKKTDIVREFAVTFVPAVDGDPTEADHLLLTPRPDSRMARRFKSVDFWIQNVGPHKGLPVRVKTAKLDGAGRHESDVTMEFTDVKINPAFAASTFDIAIPPGYDLREERLPAQKTP